MSTKHQAAPTVAEQILRISNLIIVASLVVLTASALLSYSLEQTLSITSVLIGHLLIIASATTLKLAYIGRCAAQFQLGQRVG